MAYRRSYSRSGYRSGFGSGRRYGRRMAYSKGARPVSGRRVSGRTKVSSESLKKSVRDLALRAIATPTSQKLRGICGPKGSLEVGDVLGSRPDPQSFFRVPVTQALPSPLKEGKKVRLTGVSLRMTVRFAASVGVVAVCYPAGVQPQALVLPRADGAVREFPVGFLDDKNVSCRLMRAGEAGLLSPLGPWAVISERDGSVSLDSPGGSVLGCRQSKGDGAPVGMAKWKAADGTGAKRKAKVYHEEFHVASTMRDVVPENNTSVQRKDSRMVEVFFAINRDLEYKGVFADKAGTAYPMFGEQLELMVGVVPLESRGPSQQFEPLVDVSGVLVDVYHWD